MPTDSRASFLQYRLNINHPGPHPTIPQARGRLRRERTAVNIQEPGANASYNALVTRLEKRFTRGLTFLTSYTWSHNIDNATQFLDSGLFNVANQYDRNAERSSANIDMRQSFTTSFTWELPLGKGRSFGSDWGGALDAILGGWQVSGLLSLRTGFPFDVTFPGDPQNTGSTNRVGDGKLSNRQLTTGSTSRRSWPARRVFTATRAVTLSPVREARTLTSCSASVSACPGKVTPCSFASRRSTSPIRRNSASLPGSCYGRPRVRSTERASRAGSSSA